jgi:hypothetical protein
VGEEGEGLEKGGVPLKEGFEVVANDLNELDFDVPEG